MARHPGRASAPQRNEETTDSLHAGAVGVPATLESSVPTNRMKKTDAAGMQQQQQLVDIGSGRPGDHVHWGPSTEGRNDPSAGSVGASVILGGTADWDTPRRKSTETGKTKRRNGEGDVSLLMRPHYALSVSEKHGHESTCRGTDRRESRSCILERPCPSPGRNHRWTARERLAHVVRPADSMAWRATAK
jgi:hypothetical protein